MISPDARVRCGLVPINENRRVMRSAASLQNNETEFPRFWRTVA
jgi:hypothetical protein